jgi:hypothetical protein
MIHFKSWKRPGKSGIWVHGTREALRSRSRRRPRPRFLGSGVMECWSTGVLRFVRIAPSCRGVGIACREAATDLSPGFQPWVRCLIVARPESGARDWRGCVIQRTNHSAQTVWRHFQGASFDIRNPGLKPWAMICSRFAATPTDSPDKI